MIIVLRPQVGAAEVRAIEERVEGLGCRAIAIEGTERSVLALVGDTSFDPEVLHGLSGIVQILRVGRPYRLASREAQAEPTCVRIGDAVIGPDRVAVIAGAGPGVPADVAASTLRACAEQGVTLLRAREPLDTVLPLIVEVESVEAARRCSEAAALFVPARHMHNDALLDAAAAQGPPVILERSAAATVDEWLVAAERLLVAGRREVVLCERGIRTFAEATHHTLDLSAIPVLRERTHLPVIVDPSHATGVRAYVTPMARAAVGAGADGVVVEVGPREDARSLSMPLLRALVREIQTIAPVVNRRLDLRTLRPVEPQPRGATTEAHCAFQGENGAFSQAAARQVFGPDVTTLPCPSFASLFVAVEDGRADFGILPVENTLGGEVHECFDLLREHSLHVVGEHKLRVVHNLIANPGATIDSIRRVYAHPQAAAQCAAFLKQHPDWVLHQVYDTAGAAMMIQEEGGTDGAAIAGPRVADQLGMQMLAEEIESHPENYTRFLVLSREPSQPAPGVDAKASLVYDTADQPGALLETLKVFAEHGVNLCKLVSRPIPGRPWQYRFHVDVVGRATPALLEALREHVAELQHLGTYPAA